MLRNFVTVVALLIILGSCAVANKDMLSRPVGSPLIDSASATHLQPLASPQATQSQFVSAAQVQGPQVVSATPTDGPTPTATVDVDATTRAAQATSDQQHVLIAQATAQGAADNLTAVSIQATSAQDNRNAGSTAQAAAATRDAFAATVAADKAEMERRAPTIIAAATQATFTEAHEQAGIARDWGLGIGGGLGFALGGLALLIGVVRLLPARERTLSEGEKQELDDIARGYEGAPRRTTPSTFVQDRPLTGPFPSASVRVLPVGVREETMRTFAAHVSVSGHPGGDPFTRGEWVDSGKMKDAEWEALRLFLSQKGYARPINPKVTTSAWTFTPAGEMFLDQWRNASPSPSLPDWSQETTSPESFPARGGNNNGGGVVGNTEVGQS